MRIVHRVSISADSKICKELAALGVVVDEGFASFDADESHESWGSIKEWIKMRGASDFVTTKFSKKELSEADWLVLLPTWHHGYPQPNEDDFGFREATYDLTEYCEVCGAGLRQSAPFQMKSEPKWGKNSVLQLNWIFDEYFATPDVWKTIFRPNGVACRQVLDTKGVELKSVVQLIIPDEVEVVTNGLEAMSCQKCGRDKFLPVTRGFFPPLETYPQAEMFKTKQYFGSGASAYQRVIVSQRLASLLTAEKVKGVSMWPVTKNRE